MALGVALLGWLACAAFLVGVALVAHFVVPLAAGFLWQGSVSSQLSTSRARYGLGLWVAWTLAALLAAVVPQEFGLRAPWSLADSLAQQAGLALGIGSGALGPPVLDRLLRALEPLSRAALAALGAAAILLPLAPEAPLLDPASGWRLGSTAAYLKALPAQVYLALKSVILWVPLGMLYALAQKEAALERWAIAAVLAFLAAGLPLLHGVLKVQDAIELLAAYWGIWLGARLGVALRSSLPEREPAPIVTATPAERLSSRIAVAALMLGVVAWAWLFPRWGPALAVGLALYAALLARYRHAWLLVVPTALPLLNLAPGTGRFYFDEFDLLVLATLAMAFWHGPVPAPRALLPRALGPALALFGVSVAISLVIGLLPISPLDANAFATYWSHYNGLRVVKGFFWAVALLALLRLRTDERMVMRLFVPGIWLGLAGVIAAGLWERWLFAGLADLDVPYRITATFSSMHTGGSEIETYLVIAIPFVWLAFSRGQPAAVRLAGIGLLAAGAYLMTLTIARAGVAALAVALCILCIGAWREHRRRQGATVLAVVALLAGAAALAFGLTGGYLQKRLAETEKDWAVRESHWHAALAMRDHDWSAMAFGMGLGRFPETYLFRSGAATLPATYGFVDEAGERFLRLGSGETSYLAQRVAVTPGQRYTLSLRVRTSDAGTRLHVPLCERHLLDSFRCEWRSVSPPADGKWHALSVAIDSGSVGSGNWLTRRPVELTLYNETERSSVDIDDVQLLDETGRGLVRNGSFSAGPDYWFFKTHSHLPWHVKNLWVELLFEQGWFGVIGFILLLAAALWPLWQAMWRGGAYASALLAAIGGFLAVGMFGSLFDTPRIALLFYLLLLLAGTAGRASDFFTHDRSPGV